MPTLGLLTPDAFLRVFTNLGVVAPGATLTTELSGTSTPFPVYTTNALTVAHPNPVVASSSGLFPAIFLATGITYRFTLRDQFGVIIAGPQDGIATGQSLVADTPSTVAGVAGENLAAGDVVYLSDGSGGLIAGRWYKADADFIYASSGAALIGMVQTAILNGASGVIVTQGRVTGLSGLIAGTDYYVSTTSGQLTSTIPSNGRLVGRADSTTSLILDPGPAGPAGYDIIQIEALSL